VSVVTSVLPSSSSHPSVHPAAACFHTLALPRLPPPSRRPHVIRAPAAGCGRARPRHRPSGAAAGGWAPAAWFLRSTRTAHQTPVDAGPAFFLYRSRIAAGAPPAAPCIFFFLLVLFLPRLAPAQLHGVVRFRPYADGVLFPDRIPFHRRVVFRLCVK
jgi:hypothetical protein